MSLKKYTLIFM